MSFVENDERRAVEPASLALLIWLLPLGLVLGLGLTTTACYIFLAILVAPALEKLGRSIAAVPSAAGPKLPNTLWPGASVPEKPATGIPVMAARSAACLPPPATAAFNAQVILASFTINGVWTNGASARSARVFGISTSVLSRRAAS